MTFHLRLKRISEPKHTRLKFDLKKLKDPNVLETVQAMIGRNFAPLTIINEDADMDSTMTTFNAALIETTIFLANIARRKKKPGSLQKSLICATKAEN